MFIRENYLKKIDTAFEKASIVILGGPKECGKTSVGRAYAERCNGVLYDLRKTPIDISQIDKATIIDGLHKQPELLTQIAEATQAHALKHRLLIIGLVSPEIVKQFTNPEIPIVYLEMTPLTLSEVDDWQKLWFRGGHPKSYLVESNRLSFYWRQEYLDSTLKIALPNTGIQPTSQQLYKVAMAIAEQQGEPIQVDAFAEKLNFSPHTLKHCLNILCQRFLLRVLPRDRAPPDNIFEGARLFFRDSGLLHSLLGIESPEQLFTHTIKTYSWQGFILENIINVHDIPPNAYCYGATSTQDTVDLIIQHKNQRIGFKFEFEFLYLHKYREAQGEDHLIQRLHLDRLYHIFPGEGSFPIGHDTYACSLSNYVENVG